MPANEDRPDADNVEATQKKATNLETNHVEGLSLEELLGLASAGIHLWPLRLNRDGEPKSLLHTGIQASTDPAQIRAWWADDQREWGFDAAASRLAIVDLDVKHGKDGIRAWYDGLGGLVEGTLALPTGSGGRHLVYRLPEAYNGMASNEPLRRRNTSGVLGDGVDYVAKGNVRLHPSAELRDWIAGGCSSSELTGLPGPVKDKLRGHGELTGPPVASGERPGLVAMPNGLTLDDFMRPLPDGSRNENAYSLARALARAFGDGGRRFTTALVQQACDQAGIANEAATIVQSAYKDLDGVTIPDWLPESAREDLLGLDPEVRRAVERLIVRETAGRAYRAMTEPPAPAFDIGSLGEVLSREPEPPHRIEGLQPYGANVILVGQRKRGKSTLSLNWARSLLTGEQFLGRFQVQPIAGRVAYLNYEVSAGQFARWADEHGIDHDRMIAVNLRGRRNPFLHTDDLDRLAERLAGLRVEALIVDPFAKAYTDTDQDNNGKVASWLGQLDQFARSGVGATEVLLNVHAGWNGERSRGASALEDWPDGIWNITGESETRYFKAMGRDVELEEERLDYDHQSRTLLLTGTARRSGDPDKAESKRGALMERIKEALIGHPEGLSGRGIQRWLKDNGGGVNATFFGEVLALMVEKGGVCVKDNGFYSLTK